MASFTLNYFTFIPQLRNVVRINTARSISSTACWRSNDEPKFKDHLLESHLTSLKCKGFLRSHKTYNPSSDVTAKIQNVCQKFMNVKEFKGALGQQRLDDRVQRFKILTACMQAFDHPIVNSQLHKMNTIDDLIDYFTTPVKGTTSYDDLHASNDLPPNLHIKLEYTRFHPETDTLFGGISAFPGRSTIVTGLKYKKKYKGFKSVTPFEKAKSS